MSRLARIRRWLCRHEFENTGDVYRVPDTNVWLTLVACSRCGEAAITTNQEGR